MNFLSSEKRLKNFPNKHQLVILVIAQKNDTNVTTEE